MQQAQKGSYQIDFVIQSIVIIPMLIGYTFGVFIPGLYILGLAMQFFVGLFQVLSGILRVVKYQDTLRKKYLTVAIPYVIFLIIGSNFGQLMPMDYIDILAFILVILIPVGIALWYYKLTFDQSRGKNPYSRKSELVPIENVLDDMVL